MFLFTTVPFWVCPMFDPSFFFSSLSFCGRRGGGVRKPAGKPKAILFGGLPAQKQKKKNETQDSRIFADKLKGAASFKVPSIQLGGSECAESSRRVRSPTWWASAQVLDAGRERADALDSLSRSPPRFCGLDGWWYAKGFGHPPGVFGWWSFFFGTPENIRAFSGLVFWSGG